ncbi:cupin domain-containing protein [Dyella silvatica]|uniref:cupin domain-containing protein n=1 Tax=Dyella silvatica TaxID=2992128 RepID=UPI0022504044|nr:cupin domain-containing protein [Dyella silvatica]
MTFRQSFLALLCLPLMAYAQEPQVYHPASLPTTTVAPGVSLKELTGLSAAGSAHSERVSVALFHLEPGRASAWSHNKNGEESFFVLKGNGSVWTGHRWQPVKPGSYVVIPASHVRSIRANHDESLDFYAITAPAWTQDDDVHTAAPAGAN